MSHGASLATARGIHLWNCWNVVHMECIILYFSGNKKNYYYCRVGTVYSRQCICCHIPGSGKMGWNEKNHKLAQKMKKANFRDLIAATGLVILLKLDSNRRFFAHLALQFDGWPQQIIRHVFYTTSSFVYHLISISEFKLELQYGNAQSGSN